MVDCSARGLTAVPAGIPNATVELQLQDNLIDELGGNNELRGLAQLRELNLADNRLVRLEAAAFAGLGDLRELDLSNNQLVQLPGAIFAGLGQLTTLSLVLLESPAGSRQVAGVAKSRPGWAGSHGREPLLVDRRGVIPRHQLPRHPVQVPHLRKHRRR